jgi:nicotinamidase/pyrazinamidase
MSETRKTIIVIDMLNGFCREGNLASRRLDSITPRLHGYLEKEEAGGADIVFLVDTHAPDDPEFAIFPVHCVEGSGEDEIVPELAAIAGRGTVIRKHTYSGFRDTNLDDVLARSAPDVVEVAGVCTDICVLHTVYDLKVRGYQVLVHSDLVETYDGPEHDANEINRFALTHMRDVLGATVE